MFWTVVREVTPLTQSGEIVGIVIAWIMIEMGACQHYAR